MPLHSGVIAVAIWPSMPGMIPKPSFSSVLESVKGRGYSAEVVVKVPSSVTPVVVIIAPRQHVVGRDDTTVIALQKIPGLSSLHPAYEPPGCTQQISCVLSSKTLDSGTMYMIVETLRRRIHPVGGVKQPVGIIGDSNSRHRQQQENSCDQLVHRGPPHVSIVEPSYGHGGEPAVNPR